MKAAPSPEFRTTCLGEVGLVGRLQAAADSLRFHFRDAAASWLRKRSDAELRFHLNKSPRNENRCAGPIRPRPANGVPLA